MNFQQLRYIRAAVQHDLNLTRVANELFTSQSGVSKQIRELEAELKMDIFVRRGKRLVGLTEAGRSAATVIDRLLQEAENLKRLSDQFIGEDHGRLVIATTHNQANYVLPPVLMRFAAEYPDVEVELRQGTPTMAAEMLLHGEADLAVATEAIDRHAGLNTFPCFSWDHVAIVRHGHPLSRIACPTLADLAAHPIITYTPEFSGRSNIDAAFAEAGIKADIRLAAVDADIIKTYVQLGMGVGIVAQMAITNDPRDAFVTIAGSSRFFRPSSTKVAVARGSLLRSYAVRLIAMLAPHLDLRRLTASEQAPQSDILPALSPFSQRPDLHVQPELMHAGQA
ncbi:LysR family transcriptional regulator [Altererythrobacter xixiisoli]|uniref:LysR family transcriptional regulator n=1 Tax=Croceibacterium xixiisoli TaxID=1476466 RepID=A0A6I4TXD8_9SPHN|nr:LysR substrate-binding domain-containing protein [Croceibacterium xixiisoli]MXO99751.1 LysR family transcriptional regulator [Croceibacterium xixiisoli]